MVAIRNLLSCQMRCAWCSSLESPGEFRMIILLKAFSKRRAISATLVRPRISLFPGSHSWTFIRDDVNVPKLRATFPELAGKIQDAAARLQQLLFRMLPELECRLYMCLILWRCLFE